MSVSLRAPLVPLAQPANGQLEIEDHFDNDGSQRVRYIGDEAAGLRLNPLFAGQLAFKPAANATVPLDPAASGAAPIPGHLFLQISSQRQHALKRQEASLNYPLLLVYHDVALDTAFFQGTVLTAVRRPGSSSFKKIKLNGQRLNSAAEICHAFASGALSIMLYGTKEHTFPHMPAGASPNERSIDLTLGIRTHLNPYQQPPRLSSLAPDSLYDPTSFVPLPLSYLGSRLQALPTWPDIVHDDFADHPFWAACDALPAYHRLRLFPPGPREASSRHLAAFDQLTLKADRPDGSTAWTIAVNRLGDHFIARPAGEDLLLSATVAGSSIPLAADPAAANPDITIPWPASTNQLDLTAFLDLHGDPLSLDPPIELYRGLRDAHGLTVDRRRRLVIAEQELIRPLQQELHQFGWAPPVIGLYGRRTGSAVRGFQEQAQTRERLDENGTVTPSSVTPWTGAVNGTADASTLTEMRHWRTHNYHSVAGDKMWPLLHSWDEKVTGSNKSYAEYYHTWIQANLDRFNDEVMACNWYPLRLLIEYAAAHSLRLRLRYWRPTKDPDMSPIHIHDSHSGAFDSRSHFYRRTKSTVTSKMIGMLNTEAILTSDRRVGDLIILDRSDVDLWVWHSLVVTRDLGGFTCNVQSGSLPLSNRPVPSARTEEIENLPTNAYENSYRRWKFADFDLN
ncbi:MAG: hypothetical protein KDE34_02315 [Anaerolineales bacterium]|nr:hypothetical protein [Anaerolineales bacterium]MCB8960168.1 hypothetical protein [Ardenticatenales bacterium]